MQWLAAQAKNTNQALNCGGFSCTTSTRRLVYKAVNVVKMIKSVKGVCILPHDSSFWMLSVFSCCTFSSQSVLCAVSVFPCLVGLCVQLITLPTYARWLKAQDRTAEKERTKPQQAFHMVAVRVVMAGHDNEATVEIPQLQKVGVVVDVLGAHEMRKQFDEDDVETGYTHGVNLDVSAVFFNSSGQQCAAVSCSEKQRFGAVHSGDKRGYHKEEHKPQIKVV